jgi:hypothetical protein
MNINVSKSKQALLLGMCLIPLIGGIIGIVLIILGCNQKSRILFKIGMTGVIFTVVVYTMVYVFSQSFYDSSKSNVRLSHKVLFELKKDIENYKKKYGKYPQSLQTLAKTNQIVLINDPILLSKKDKNIKTFFEYSTEEDRYKLFSVGVDGKTNTDDDIYP